MGVTASDLTKLYLAYFGRPPDFDGVRFYTAGDIERTPIVGAGVGSDTIPLSKMLPREVDLPAYPVDTRRRRHGLSPAQRLLERQRLRRAA
jgi:hypothetical protein